MPANKNLLDTIRKLASGEIAGKVKIGSVDEQLLRDLTLMNARYKDSAAYLGRHGATSRQIKDGWSEEHLADAYRELLNSTGTRGIPNFPGREAQEAIILPNKGRSLFAPVNPSTQGEINISTLFAPENKKVLSHLDSLLASREVGKLSSMSQDHRAISAGVPKSTQRSPISAVEKQAVIEEMIERLMGGVKTAAPFAVAGAGAGLGMAPGETYPSELPLPHDPPLEHPVIDPVDMLVPASFVPGVLGKLFSVVGNTAMSLGAEAFTDMLNQPSEPYPSHVMPPWGGLLDDQLWSQ
jgi:hypothetical protein